MSSDSMPAVEAVPAAASGLSPRTGEPRRPWVAWVTLALLFAAAGVDLVALLWGMWTSVRDFSDAAWLYRAVPTALGDPIRVLLVVAVWLSSVLIGAFAVTAGYYAWAGYRWTRWAGLIAVAVGGGSFLGFWLAPWCLVPLTFGAASAWLPAMRRYFDACQLHRHPTKQEAPRPDQVFYGPLPRYS